MALKLNSACAHPYNRIKMENTTKPLPAATYACRGKANPHGIDNINAEVGNPTFACRAHTTVCANQPNINSYDHV